MTPEKLASARKEEWAATPLWWEKPVGVQRAIGWHIAAVVEAFCKQAESGKVPH